ncbi:hypothetical protein [Candidatus Borrarchaeum sp.]|uniref:hypothetical protein n=1 Tax=Candidatus Borrarchaeum sp. TaxID=2846742 RepID=UPI002580C5E5|nr:hypothetical protein [Candidatus Borrarchaeum sp.]
MKLLVLTTTFPRYVGDSVPSFVYYLCKSMNDLGVEVNVLAPHTLEKRYKEIPGMNVKRFDYFLNMGYGLPPKLKSKALGNIGLLFLFIQCGSTQSVFRKLWISFMGIGCSLQGMLPVNYKNPMY